MENKEKFVRVGIGVMIFNDKNQVLLGKRLAKLAKDTWCFPGGHLEFNETFKECAIRETKEECNLDVIPEKIISITNDIAYDKHYITIGMLAKLTSGKPKVNEPDKCERWEWFDLDNLPKPMMISTEKMIIQYKEGKIDEKL